MASITIRDVPDHARDELAARAARSGRSLQEYLRLHLTEIAERPDLETIAARISARKAGTGTNLGADTIVRFRDEGRR